MISDNGESGKREGWEANVTNDAFNIVMFWNWEGGGGEAKRIHFYIVYIKRRRAQSALKMAEEKKGRRLKSGHYTSSSSSSEMCFSPNGEDCSSATEEMWLLTTPIDKIYTSFYSCSRYVCIIEVLYIFIYTHTHTHARHT